MYIVDKVATRGRLTHDQWVTLYKFAVYDSQTALFIFSMDEHFLYERVCTVSERAITRSFLTTCLYPYVQNTWPSNTKNAIQVASRTSLATRSVHHLAA